MGTRLRSEISLEGPFFRGNPVRTWRRNIADLMKAVAREGEADVRQQMRQGQAGRAPVRGGVEPPRVADHVRGRAASLSGKRWEVTAIVSVNNRGQSPAGGIALMAAGAEVEDQTGAMKRTRNRMRRALAISRADLLKGLR